MARMLEIEQRLSMLKQKQKHLMYLITEDREILQSVFMAMPELIKSFIGGYPAVKAENLYRVAIKNGALNDAYEQFPLRDNTYISEIWKKTDSGKMKDDPVFFYLNDFHIISEKAAAHFLKQFLVYAHQKKQSGQHIVLFLISPVLKIPEGFYNEMEVVDVPEMDEEDNIQYLRQKALEEYHGQCKSLDEVDSKRISEAAKDLKGISERGIRDIIADLQTEFGSFFGRALDCSGEEKNLSKIRAARKGYVAELKKREARYDSTVTILEADDSMEGLDEFKAWILDRKDEFLDIEIAHSYGNEPPKGVLLTGVPGSGKTQAAKKVAAILGGERKNVPLVQFRMDNLLGGLVGDSEANFKRCRKRIEAMAPCVVLMDEIEKTFETKSGSDNSSVKMNILTALLDWMQENKKQIFFYATSNSVSQLRPELLRDGRFDMRFCVFMPTQRELISIFEFHMKRSNRRAQNMLFVPGFSYEAVAEKFLETIAKADMQSKKDHKRNASHFYTGANVENLVAQTNRELFREKRERNFDEDEYGKKLLQVANGKYSQPYGMTNMGDIAQFWLSAWENQYTNAAKFDLLPFSSFQEGRFYFDDTSRLSLYDSYMRECISKEIINLYEETEKRRNY